MAGALKQLEVERGDAVDDPATGRPWLVLKTEDPDEIEANLQNLAEASAGAIEAIQKGAVALDPLSAKKLERLVKMLGPKHFKGTFTIRKCGSEDDADAAKATQTPEATAKPTQEAAKEISLAKDSIEVLKGFTTAVSDLKTTLEKHLDPPEGEKPEEEEEGAPPQSRGLAKRRSDEDPESSQLETGRRQNVKKSAPKHGEGLFENIVFGD